MLFWPGARVFDHRWPITEGTVSMISYGAVHVMFDNGRFDRYTRDRAPIMLGRVA